MNIYTLLALCTERQASDLHLSAGLPPMLRVDGEMETLDMPQLAAEPLRNAISELTGGAGDQRGDADFCFETSSGERFRANVFEHQRGPGAAFRAIPKRVPRLATLGMGEDFERIASARNGLVLVTGATGSGKSTTLAALVDHLNATRRQHILTIEDPIEFVHEPRLCLVNQREVGRHAPDFAGALRSALREDPDVILIGEMRDAETIRLALTAAETGHLVLATLHTPSAPNAVTRIVDVFPGSEKDAIRVLLADSLQAVIAQTLLKRARGGRVAAHEILIATPAIRNLIREQKIAQIYSAMQTGGAAGMQTLDMSLQALVARGDVEVETARAKARSPDTLGGAEGALRGEAVRRDRSRR